MSAHEAIEANNKTLAPKHAALVVSKSRVFFLVK